MIAAGGKTRLDGTVKLRHQVGSDTLHVGPRRASTTISCGSITQIFVNLTIPNRQVALMILPDAFAADLDLLAFEAFASRYQGARS